MLLVQQLLNGLLVGGVYVLFALGLSLALGVLRVFNIAHAATLMVSAVLGVAFVEATQAPFILVLGFGVATGAALGLLYELVAFKPLRRRDFAQVEQYEFATLIASLALLMILESAAQIYTRTQYLSFPSAFFVSGPVGLPGGVTVRSVAILMFVVALGLSLLVWYVVRGTDAGRVIRAVAADAETAQMLGHNATAYSYATMAGASALAGVAGILIGTAFSSVHFLMGHNYLLRGFVILVIGGIGSIPGTLIAGLGLGLAEGATVHFMGSGWRDGIGFALMMALLVFRPRGLFGAEEVDRA